MNSSTRAVPQRFFEELSRLGKAVSAPKRLEILDLLGQGPRNVETLAQQADVSLANASHHLKVLRGARLVETTKKGLHVEYRLADAEVRRFLLALRRLGRARLAEIDQIARNLSDRTEDAEHVGREELLRRVKDGAVTVIDVRPAEEYGAGHIPGAISIPLGKLKKRLRELPKDREIVAYCRGPFCVMAVEAVELLRKRGFKAQRMEHGVDEWRATGGRIEKDLKDAG